MLHEFWCGRVNGYPGKLDQIMRDWLIYSVRSIDTSGSFAPWWEGLVELRLAVSPASIIEPVPVVELPSPQSGGINDSGAEAQIGYFL